MRAYLIDPESKTVSEVDYSGDYKHISELIGCSIFTALGIEDGDTIFLDDEGLLVEGRIDFFMYAGHDHPLAGKGLVLGTDEEGESIEPRISLSALAARVSFPSVRFKGFAHREGRMNHPIIGDCAYIENIPIFEEVPIVLSSKLGAK